MREICTRFNDKFKARKNQGVEIHVLKFNFFLPKKLSFHPLEKKLRKALKLAKAHFCGFFVCKEKVAI